MKLPFASWRSTAVMMFSLVITTMAVVHEHHIKVNFDALRDLMVNGSNNQVQQTPTVKIETDFLVQKIGQLKNEKEQLQLSQSTMILSMKNLQKQSDRMQNDNLVLREIIQSQQEEKDIRGSDDGESFWWRITTLVLGIITIVQYMIGQIRMRALNDIKHDKAALLTQTKTLDIHINDLQDQLKLSHLNLTKALKDRDSLLNETTMLEDRILELEDRIETDKITMTKLKKDKEYLQSRIVILEVEVQGQAQALVAAVIPLAQTDMVTTAAMIPHGCDIITDAVQGNGLIASETSRLHATNKNHSCASSSSSSSPPSHSSNPDVLSSSSLSLATGLIAQGEDDNSGIETLHAETNTENENENVLTSLYRTPGSRNNSSSIRGNHTSTSVFSSGNGSGSNALPRPRSRR